MRRVFVGALLVLALPACAARAPSTGGTGPPPLVEVDVATGLDTVWALAFAPDGSLHATERGGTIKSWQPSGDGRYQEAAFTEVGGVVESGEAGLMGLAIDAKARWFVMYTSDRENRIARLEPDGSQKVLVEGIAAGSVHDGGRLAFGPDGMLYASTGDAGDKAGAPHSPLNGKVLRVDPDTGEHEVFSTGHRNPQGLCFAPNGKLFSTEHGPDEGDEVNILEEGRDYGWPETVGTGLANYTPTIAPSGCAVYEADLIPQWKGDLLFGTLKDESLRRLDLDPDGELVGQERLYAGEFGRIRDVVVGPDGAVYLATSNRDGRGDPRDDDDRIVRIAPA
ncbi:MAG TPA: PQQ-dependent sugar dehydrogenase [Acidimicrobiales bacterium]|nr:PQQ-dependent sugar dehydrogenase [Acidimicrobiales bacterium]